MSSDNLTTVERRAPPSQAAVADSCSVGTGSTLVAGLTARRESQVGAAHACALRTLRKRNQPQAPPDAPADPSLLPEAPRKTLIHVGVGGTLAELEWKPSDGLPASSFLSEWRSRDWLASTTLPVILTLFWIPAEERWRGRRHQDPDAKAIADGAALSARLRRLGFGLTYCRDFFDKEWGQRKQRRSEITPVERRVTKG